MANEAMELIASALADYIGDDEVELVDEDTIKIETSFGNFFVSAQEELYI